MTEAMRRLGARRAILSAGVTLALGYAVLGGLSPLVGVAGLLGLSTWAALWPMPHVADPPPGVVAEPPPAVPVPELEPADWQSIVEGIPAPAMLLDRRGVIIASNGPAREIHAVRPGQHLSLALRGPALKSAVEQALQTGQTQTADLQISVPVERALTSYTTPLAPALVQLGPALLVVLRDRTEEQQLAEMRADFVANASHELRTPLASVKGFIETLRGAARDDPAARERFLGIMQDQADRMSRLIDDLLSLSRIEMHEHVAPRDAVDLGTVADDVVKTLAPQAEAAGQRVSLALEKDAALVRGDRDELVQVVQNLVQNAIKYGRRGGQVAIKVARDGQSVGLIVADDGIGIAPEHVPRLTERFYRVSAKDSRERGGTGLGLAIVKHIVNRHRGELRIASELGRGSTFTVRLPSAEG